LHNLLDLLFLNAPLPAIKLVEQAIAYAVQHPHSVRANGGLESSLNEAAEGSDAYAGTNEEHGPVGDEFMREGVGHQAAEHGDAEIKLCGLDAVLLCFLDLFGYVLEEAGADTCAGAAVPVGRFVDCDGEFDQAPTVGAIAGAGELGSWLRE